MVALVDLVTAFVLIVSVPELLPDEIVTVDGTVADPESLDIETAIPPLGAGPVKLIVPTLDLPPFTDEGLTDSDLIEGGAIVSVADFEVVPSLAVSVATD